MSEEHATALPTLPAHFTPTKAYGKTLWVGNRTAPSALVALVHGLGDTAEGWEVTANEMARALPHVLMMLPTASKEPVTVNGGARMTSWYDIRCLGWTEEEPREDGEGVYRSAKDVAWMVREAAARWRVPASRVVLAGFSQGAAVAIAAGLIAPFSVRGVVGMSGYFGGRRCLRPHIVPSNGKAVPMRLFHGQNDSLIDVSAARQSVAALREAGVADVSLTEYPRLGHSVEPREIHDVVQWIKELVP